MPSQISPDSPEDSETLDYPSRAPTWKIAPQALPRYINSVAVSADGNTVIGGTFYHSYGSAPAARRSSTVADKVTAAGKVKAAVADTFGTYCYNGDGSLRSQSEFLAAEGVYWVGVGAMAATRN